MECNSCFCWILTNCLLYFICDVYSIVDSLLSPLCWRVGSSCFVWLVCTYVLLCWLYSFTLCCLGENCLAISILFPSLWWDLFSYFLICQFAEYCVSFYNADFVLVFLQRDAPELLYNYYMGRFLRHAKSCTLVSFFYRLLNRYNLNTKLLIKRSVVQEV